MEESVQWQVFTETGDICYYLRYKEAQAMAGMPPQKENADGRICDISTSFTGSEI